MEHRSKLGVAAMSLAAAATLLPAGAARADDICVKCPEPGDAEFVYLKIDSLFLKLETVAPPAIEPEALVGQIYLKLDGAFLKIE